MENGWLEEFIYNPLGVKLPMTSQQKEIIKDLRDNRYNYYLKSRQIGFSELLINYIAKKLLTETDFNIVLITSKEVLGFQRIKSIKSIINYLEPNLVHSDKRNSLELTNGNKISSVGATLDKIKGYGFELLVVDECFDEQILACALPNLSARENSQLILGSSLFSKDFANFIKKIEGIQIKKLHYSNCSLYDENRISYYKNFMGNSFKYEMDLNVDEFLNSLKSKEKSRILQFRVDNGLENKILERLIENDVSLSEYIRNLIIKDLYK